MLIKKQSYGTAYWWLQGHSVAMERYLNRFYPIYDWRFIRSFFYKFPIQAKIILEDFRKSNLFKQREVIKILLEGKSKLIYIVGARGMGKSCQAGWIIEELHKEDSKLPIYLVGSGIFRIFPKWVHYTDTIDEVPNGSFAIVDEASIRYNAREFYKQANIDLGKLMSIARHKEISILFITQHVNLIDVNITRLRDIVIWKKSNTYSIGEGKISGGRMGKAEQFWNRVRMNMAPRSKEETLFEYPAEKRFIHFTHVPPRFWNETISKSFSDYKFDNNSDDGNKKKNLRRPVIRI